MRKIIIIFVIAIAMIMGTFVSNYTRLVLLEEQVDDSYKSLQGGFIALANTIEPLAKTSSHWMLNRQGMISDMRDAAHGLHSAKSVGGYHDAYDKLVDAVQNVDRYASALVIMNFSKEYSRTMESYKEADKNVQFDIEKYNVTVKQYNDCFTRFPYIITGRVMGFSKKEYF